MVRSVLGLMDECPGFVAYHGIQCIGEEGGLTPAQFEGGSGLGFGFPAILFEFFAKAVSVDADDGDFVTQGTVLPAVAPDFRKVCGEADVSEIKTGSNATPGRFVPVKLFLLEATIFVPGPGTFAEHFRALLSTDRVPMGEIFGRRSYLVGVANEFTAVACR